MARVRNASPANSTSNSQKRARESASPARPPKRRQEWNLDLDAPNLPQTLSRENSPSKNVHWRKGKRIISGPTVSSPERRSKSPTRPALRRPMQDQDERDDGDEHHHGPSAQLQADLCSAEAVQLSKARSPNKPSKSKDLPSAVKTTGKGKENIVHTQTLSTARPYGGAGQDQDICQFMEDLKQQLADFVKTFPSRPKKAKSNVLSQLITEENKQLIHYVGCIALAGGEGAESWQDLMTDDVTRRAVVWGVVGRALKEAVFDEVYFGAWPELHVKLEEMQQSQVQQDGFYRQRARSDEIKKQEAGYSRTQNDAHLSKASVLVTLGIEAMLMPLWCLGDKATNASWLKTGKRADLFSLVLSAGKVARSMRASRDVIYYWPPTFKDEEFEPARMECLNLNDMIRTSPYDREEVHGRDQAILREGHAEQSQAIVRVVCFPGIQAYRQGGGDLAKEQLAADRKPRNANHAPPDVVQARRQLKNRYGKEYTGHEGIRTRIVSKSVVLLQWGQQRLLTKEAGTSVHIDAVKNGELSRYIEDGKGHVELHKLFEERIRSQQTTPQTSPSFLQRFGNWYRGNAAQEGQEETVGDGEEAEYAHYKEDWGKRQAENRGARGHGAVGAPAPPRSRKGSRRSR